MAYKVIDAMDDRAEKNERCVICIESKALNSEYSFVDLSAV